MKQTYEKKTFRQPLTGSGIDALSEEMQRALTAMGCDARRATGLRLSAEELLLNWQKHFGPAAECTLTVSRRLRKPCISLALPGERLDPTGDELQNDYGRRLLARQGLRPAFSYTRNTNILRFELPMPEINPLIPIAAAAGLAVAIGLLGRGLSPEIRDYITVELLQRVQDAFFGLLSMVALPLIFFSLITGICGIGDTAVLSGVGTRLVSRLFLSAVLMVSLIGTIGALLFRLDITTSGSFAGGLSDILDMLFGMIPTNVVDSFLQGSFTHILLLAVGIGMAMLIMGKQCSLVVQGAEQLQGIFDLLMRWVCKLLPAGVFAVLLNNIWSNSIRDILNIWKPVVLAVSWITLYLVAHLSYIGFRAKVSPRLLWRKILPVFLVGITSASSTAAYGDAARCCTDKLGIDKKLVDFGLPLSLAISSVGSSSCFMAAVVCSMAAYDVAVTPGGFAIAFVLCALLVMSSPSTAGGPVSCFAILFAHLAIPEAALGITILAYLLLDFPATGVNICSKTLFLLQQALQENAVDLQRLRQKHGA